MDKGTPGEVPGIITKPPFKNQYGEWFVVVAIIQEEMSPKDYDYHPARFEVRTPKERVTL